MAFKLSKDHKKRRDEIVAALETKKQAITDAITAYNESLEDARDFLNNDLVGTFNDEFSERSEKWQGGDRGEATRTWIDELDGIASDFDDVDEPDIEDHIEKLNLLEEEPAY